MCILKFLMGQISMVSRATYWNFFGGQQEIKIYEMAGTRQQEVEGRVQT